MLVSQKCQYALRALFELDCHLGYRVLQKAAQVISNRLKDTRIEMLSLVHL